jgi:ElaB/YqjD/DUF883 family membrane-anchored ribosome-binding protein
MAETSHSQQDVTGQVGEKVETASEKVREGATHFGEKASEAMQNVQEAGAEARRAAQQQLGQMRDTAAEYLDQGRAQMQEMGQTLEHRIHEQPFRSVLMAAGLGFLLGMLWTRR